MSNIQNGNQPDNLDISWMQDAEASAQKMTDDAAKFTEMAEQTMTVCLPSSLNPDGTERDGGLTIKPTPEKFSTEDIDRALSGISIPGETKTTPKDATSAPNARAGFSPEQKRSMLQDISNRPFDRVMFTTQTKTTGVSATSGPKDPTTLARTGTVVQQQSASLPKGSENVAGSAAATIASTPNPAESKTADAVSTATNAAQTPGKRFNLKEAASKFLNSILSKLGIGSERGAVQSQVKAEKTQTKASIVLDELPKEVQTATAQAPVGNPEIKGILKKGEGLIDRFENIKNNCVKLMDVLNLSVPQGQTPESFANQILEDLAVFKKASDNNENPLPKVQGKDVPAKDISGLNSLAQKLENATDRKLFLDVVQAKYNAKHEMAFLSSTVEQSMQLMKTPDDAKMIGTYLMSECTVTAGGLRRIDPKALTVLLNDPRIKESPLLKEAVLNAANEVMHKAVRKCQSNIVFQALKDSGVDKEQQRTLPKKWTETAEKLNNQNLDLSGIEVIAESAGFKVKISAQPDDTNQQELANMLTTMAEVSKATNEAGISSTATIAKPARSSAPASTSENLQSVLGGGMAQSEGLKPLSRAAVTQMLDTFKKTESATEKSSFVYSLSPSEKKDLISHIMNSIEAAAAKRSSFGPALAKQIRERNELTGLLNLLNQSALTNPKILIEDLNSDVQRIIAFQTGNPDEAVRLQDGMLTKELSWSTFSSKLAVALDHPNQTLNADVAKLINDVATLGKTTQVGKGGLHNETTRTEAKAFYEDTIAKSAGKLGEKTKLANFQEFITKYSSVSQAWVSQLSNLLVGQKPKEWASLQKFIANSEGLIRELNLTTRVQLVNLKAEILGKQPVDEAALASAEDRLRACDAQISQIREQRGALIKEFKNELNINFTIRPDDFAAVIEFLAIGQNENLAGLTSRSDKYQADFAKGKLDVKDLSNTHDKRGEAIGNDAKQFARVLIEAGSQAVKHFETMPEELGAEGQKLLQNAQAAMNKLNTAIKELKAGENFFEKFTTEEWTAFGKDISALHNLLPPAPEATPGLTETGIKWEDKLAAAELKLSQPPEAVASQEKPALEPAAKKARIEDTADTSGSAAPVAPPPPRAENLAKLAIVNSFKVENYNFDIPSTRPETCQRLIKDLEIAYGACVTSDQLQKVTDEFYDTLVHLANALTNTIVDDSHNNRGDMTGLTGFRQREFYFKIGRNSVSNQPLTMNAIEAKDLVEAVLDHMFQHVSEFGIRSDQYNIPSLFGH